MGTPDGAPPLQCPAAGGGTHRRDRLRPRRGRRAVRACALDRSALLVPFKACLRARCDRSAGRHRARVIAGALGLSRKALVLDLDNTLWGGVIGDDGLAGPTRGNRAAGEGFVAFPRPTRGRKRRGIILPGASKKDGGVARSPWRWHPDMVLRLDDMAVLRANWSWKADN